MRPQREDWKIADRYQTYKMNLSCWKTVAQKWNKIKTNPICAAEIASQLTATHYSSPARKIQGNTIKYCVPISPGGLIWCDVRGMSI
jgi:hypothetical protein